MRKRNVDAFIFKTDTRNIACSSMEADLLDGASAVARALRIVAVVLSHAFRLISPRGLG